MRLKWYWSLDPCTMSDTNPSSTPPPAALTGTTAGPDDVTTTPTDDDAAIRAFGGTAPDPKLSAEREQNAEITAIDTDTTNNSDVDEDTESEMNAHIPPTHDDRNRTATPPTQAGGAERGRQESPASRARTPFTTASAGDGPSATVTAPTHSTLT